MGSDLPIFCALYGFGLKVIMDHQFEKFSSILYTKLNRPAVPVDLLTRPALFKLLDSGLDGALTLVVAPAGFGKTTLVSSWLDKLDSIQDNNYHLPSAWISLDKTDRNYIVLLRHLVAAVQSIVPGSLTMTEKILYASTAMPVKLIFNILSNELQKITSPFIIVFDDFHNASSSELNELVSGWARHWPEPMRLIIIARKQPLLPLSKLRLEGHLADIRTYHLRFTPTESSIYMQMALNHQTASGHAVSTILQKMEGWVAGLKLAALSFSNHPEQHLSGPEFDSNEKQITDYLSTEVIEQQKPEVQSALMKISILEKFNSSLGLALMDEENQDPDVQSFFSNIEASDLLIISLDRECTWFRFHPLFRDYLRKRLFSIYGPDQQRGLHWRAASWYNQKGFLDQSLKHALAADDIKLTSKLIQSNLNIILNAEDFVTIEQWLQVLPESQVENDPQLLLMKAWYDNHIWDLSGINTCTGKALEMLSNETKISDETKLLLKGQILALKGVAAFHHNQMKQASANLGEALELLPENWLFARGMAANYLAQSLHGCGEKKLAEEFIVDRYHAEKGRGNSYTLRLLFGLCCIYLQDSNLEQSEQTTRKILQLSTEVNLVCMQGWCHTMLGTIYYQWDNLEQAQYHFEEAYKLRFVTMILPARYGFFGQALTCQAKGLKAEAAKFMGELSDYEIEMFGRESSEAAAMRAYLLLLQNNIEKAGKWADHYTEPPPDRPLIPGTEEPHIIRALILISRNRGNDTILAIQILDSLDDIAERTYCKRVKTKLLALRSLAQLNLDNFEDARLLLINALELAERGNMIRLFIDLGPRMWTLLEQAGKEEGCSVIISNILQTLPPKKEVSVSGEREVKTGEQHDSKYPVDAERLTPRELEALKLLAEAISLQDIADRLFISYATAKRHTINIYAKLGVHKRWDAVSTAKRKGLI